MPIPFKKPSPHAFQRPVLKTQTKQLDYCPINAYFCALKSKIIKYHGFKLRHCRTNKYRKINHF